MILEILQKPTTKLVGLLVSLLLILGCQVKPEAQVVDYSLDLSNEKGHVILLHGMFRSSYAMEPIEKFLRAQGYEVTNVSYPSTEYEIEKLVADYLAPEVDQLMNQGAKEIHFVTHSMGGILVRYYLKNNSIDNLGKVVMIAPPNKGTPLADLFSDSDWINAGNSPAKTQLSAEEGSWVQQLGPVEFELGVIAGNYNTNWVTSWLLSGEDDGVVSVDSTKVENMKDFITVPEKHYYLRASITVLQQAAYFLKHGEFFKTWSASQNNL